MRRSGSGARYQAARSERAYALLSGGNQQKVAFAKWLSLDPLVIIAEDPTSGVDVGARSAIYQVMREQAALAGLHRRLVRYRGPHRGP